MAVASAADYCDEPEETTVVHKHQHCPMCLVRVLMPIVHPLLSRIILVCVACQLSHELIPRS